MKKVNTRSQTEVLAYADDMASQGRSQDSVNFEQKHKTTTYIEARKLRKWISENPGKTRAEMPTELSGYLNFLMRKSLVTAKGAHNRTYTVREMKDFE